MSITTVFYQSVLLFAWCMSSVRKTEEVYVCVCVQLVNFFANDCQRMFELMYMLPFSLDGPLVVIASTIYCLQYIGPWALIGALVMLLYYPYQVSAELSACMLVYES